MMMMMMMMLRFSRAQVTEEKGDEKDGNEEVGFRFEFKFEFEFKFRNVSFPQVGFNI